MTEAEWDACADLTPMLEFLRGKASDRKLRLFAAACVRRVWHLLVDVRSRRVVEVAESFADQETSRELLGSARSEATAAAVHGAGYAAYAADYVAEPDLTVDLVARTIAETVAYVWEWEVNDDGSLQAGQGLRRHSAQRGIEQRKGQVSSLREIFGNPFRPVTVSPSWLAWNDGAVRKMAQVIYDDRAFDRLPILADALEDAGCADADILAHCRGLGEHVRGCWVVDLLLGKT